VIQAEPLAATWIQREDRTARVRLTANPKYWDRFRGPHLQEIVFRNDVSPEQALDLVCTTEGQVDIVTEVPHREADRVQQSEHARLVTVDAVRALAGVINRAAVGLPLHDVCARQALNLAGNRSGLISDVFGGRARPLAGLTPPTPLTALHRAPNRLKAYPFDPERARALWRQVTDGPSRPLRITAMSDWEAVAHRIARDLEDALELAVEVSVLHGEEQLTARRRLAEKTDPPEWDILLLEQGSQAADTPPLEQHRAFVGRTGEFRAGPVVPEFERLFAAMVAQQA